MANRKFQVLAIVLTMSLVTLGCFTAGAADESADGNSGDGGGSFLQNLHSMASQMHHGGGGHGHDAGDGFSSDMGDLVDRLDLSEEQTERLDSIHQNLASIHRKFDFHGGAADGSMVELHDRLVRQFEQGHVEDGAIRQMIDLHLEEIRDAAYSATDDLLALVNSLDAGQREIVLAHLQGETAH